MNEADLSLMKPVLKTEGAINKSSTLFERVWDNSDSEVAQKPAQPGIVQSFVGAFKHGLVSPIEGGTQLLHHIVGTPTVKLADAPTTAEFNSKNWYAQQFGAAIGMLPSFLLVAGGVKSGLGRFAATAETAETVSLFGARMSRGLYMTGESALAGLVYEGALRPVSEENGFWAARAQNAAVGAVTFGAMTGAAGFLGRFEALAPSASLVQKAWHTTGKTVLSAGFGGAAGAETASLLRDGRAASAEELWQSAFGMAVIGTALGGVHEAAVRAKTPFFQWSRGLTETRTEQSPLVDRLADVDARSRSAASRTGEQAGEVTEGRSESAAAHGHSRGIQGILEQGEIHNVTKRIVGEYDKEVILAEVKGANGENVPVVVRRLAPTPEELQAVDPVKRPELLADNDPWTRAKLIQANKAAALNEMIGFNNPSPAIAERTMILDGMQRRVTIEQYSGEPLIDVFRRMALEQIGPEATPEQAVPLIEKQPALKSAIEEALAERLLHANADFNPFNLAVPKPTAPDMVRVINIDEKLSFSPQETVSWGRESIQEPMKTLREVFAEKPLSEPVRERMQNFMDKFDNAQGREQLLRHGFTAEESNALFVRAHSLLANGYPKAYWVLDAEFADLSTMHDQAVGYVKQQTAGLVEAMAERAKAELVLRQREEARAQAEAQRNDRPEEPD